jgi:DNA-binding response OmpR family regulator
MSPLLRLPICQAVADSLRAQGFAVDTAASASEGLRVWRAADYDAAVLDLMLPGQSADSLMCRQTSRTRQDIPRLLGIELKSLPSESRTQLHNALSEQN